jgi:hypothetical protein
VAARPPNARAPSPAARNKVRATRDCRVVFAMSCSLDPPAADGVNHVVQTGFPDIVWLKSMLWAALPHSVAQRFRASFRFGSTPQLLGTWRKAKGRNFIAASSWGNQPRVFMTLRKVLCKDSTALVV